MDLVSSSVLPVSSTPSCAAHTVTGKSMLDLAVEIPLGYGMHNLVQEQSDTHEAHPSLISSVMQKLSHVLAGVFHESSIKRLQ